MEILLIRHGQSEADLLRVHEGAADFSLTGLGRKQAKVMAELVKQKYLPEIIWSSPLKRAFETATILSDETGIVLKTEEGLREYNNGVLAGMSFEEAARLYPEPAGGRRPHEPILKGESSLEFRFRAESTFSKILTESKGFDRIAIVSHGGMISNILKSFLNLPVHVNYGFFTGDTCMHLLKVNEKGHFVMFLNRDPQQGDMPDCC